MIFAFIMGVVLAWLRERAGSVWPGVVFHNFANVMNIFFV
ncbi:MAG: CPBP family glutamic-type intramembrane protease [Gammaproteobacteria bacterium]